MPHIFISYCKNDTRKFAFELTDALAEVPGITAWVDRSMRAGPSWELQIQEQIDRCDYFVVLYSKDINRHKEGEEPSYVLTEIGYAKRTARKPIIPIMVQKTDPPLALTNAHYLDFTLPGLSLAEMVAALCEEMNIGTGSLPPSPPPPARDPVAAIMPAPFAWIDIPAGQVTLIPDESDKKNSYLKQDTTFTVPAFRIAKYPTTNAQFRAFVQDGGYINDHWWTADGLAARKAEKWTQPRFWNDAQFNGGDQPVVGVSWYEAVAFCGWLSAKTQHKIMLPTEQQWQRAAQGDTAWAYPWGDDFIAENCRSNVGGAPASPGNTTPVTQYEGRGDSPFGVVDMIGNADEWCLTGYSDGEIDTNKKSSLRVTRGGTWAAASLLILNVNSRNYA